MDTRSKYLIKNVGILTVSNFASKLLTIFLLPLYTNILSTSEVGVYDLIVSTISLLSPILTLNITDAVLRFSLDTGYNSNVVASIGLRYILNSFVIICIILVVNRQLHFIRLLIGYEIWFLLYYIFSIFNSYLINIIKGQENIRLLGIGSFVNTFLVLLLNILFLVVFKLGLNGFFAAYILSLAFTNTLFIFSSGINRSIDLCIIDKELQRVMVRYSLPLIVTSIGWWVNSAADKFFVALICGVSANGLLAVAYKIPTIINTLQSIFLQAWQVSAVKEYKSNNSKEFYSNCYEYLCGLLFICGTFILVFNKVMAYILFAKDFYAAWEYVPFLLLSIILNTMSGYFGGILSAKQNTLVLAISAILGTIANLVLNYILITLIGIQGATISTMVSSLCIFVVRYYGILDIISFKIFRLNLINILILCIQSILNIMCIGVIYEILILIIVIVYNRKTIFKMFKLVNSIFIRI